MNLFSKWPPRFRPGDYYRRHAQQCHIHYQVAPSNTRGASPEALAVNLGMTLQKIPQKSQAECKQKERAERGADYHTEAADQQCTGDDLQPWD